MQLLCMTPLASHLHNHTLQQWGILQGLTEDKDLNRNGPNPLNPGNFTTIKLIPDGAAKFTRAMGMTCKFRFVWLRVCVFSLFYLLYSF